MPIQPSRQVPRVITIGEAMALVVPAHAESLATATDIRLQVGGAESNVASHLCSLGIATAWVSAVGDDVLGHRVVDAVAGHGVDTGWVRVDAQAPTGVYFKDPGRAVLYYRRGSAASRMTAAALHDVPLEQADIVHVSGITPALSAGCTALVESVFDRLARHRTIVSFDVNFRPALWPDGTAGAVLLALANRSDLVFVGLDEAQALWGCETAAQVRALLPAPRRLVVKDGSVGATEFDSAPGEFDSAPGDSTPGEFDSAPGGLDSASGVFVPAIPTRVVEPVGAGDAFAAGYLAALLRGASAEQRLLAGHERARLMLLSTGDVLTAPPAERSTPDDVR